MNMGQAKRRKDKGFMPDPSPKPRKTARMKANPRDSMYGMGGMGSMAMILGSLMMGSQSGRIFANRSEMERVNRERENMNDH